MKIVKYRNTNKKRKNNRNITKQNLYGRQNRKQKNHKRLYHKTTNKTGMKQVDLFP